MISANQIAVTEDAVQLGGFAGQSVTISGDATNALYLGGPNVSSTNGLTLPADTVLPLGIVTGDLWAVAADSSTTGSIGLLVSTPR